MSALVKTRLVKIGNSKGIRIPKPLLEQVGLLDQVEVEAQPGQLVIRPADAPRQGWEAQFQCMAAQNDDRLLDGEPLVPTEWEATEWAW